MNYSTFKSNLQVLVIATLVIFTSCNETVEPEPINKASSIIYSVNEAVIATTFGASSGVPTVEGSGPFTYGISKVTSANGNFLDDPSAITVNATSGVITLSDNNKLPIGDYVIDISIVNDGGSVTFTNVFKFIINEKPTNLSYDPNYLGIVEGEEFTSNVPSINGLLPIEYSIVNIQEVGSFVEINPTTGAIHVKVGVSVLGVYNIQIKCTNVLGSTSFLENILTLEILCASDLAGIHTYSTVPWCGTPTTGTTEWISESHGIYYIANGDYSFGAYIACYSPGAAFPLGDLRINDLCNLLSWSGKSQWGEVYTFNSVSVNGADLILDWENDYGEKGISTITREGGMNWPPLTK